MKISEIITDKYKLRIPPTVYYELLADVQEVEEEQEPTVETIPKAEYEARLKENNRLVNDLEELRTMINKFAESYENRLKADLKAILVELQLEIEEYKSDRLVDMERDEMARIFSELIQQKINALRAESEDQE